MSSQTQTRDRLTNAHGGTERIETVIIGAGQTGLALGYHLAKQDRPFVILEANERVGDVWRKRFDSLRLYSPARYDGLPGMAFPADQWHFPTKDEVGDYLEAYAGRFELPVRDGNVRSRRLAKDGDRYLIECDGRRAGGSERRRGLRWLQYADRPGARRRAGSVDHATALQRLPQLLAAPGRPGAGGGCGPLGLGHRARGSARPPDDARRAGPRRGPLRHRGPRRFRVIVPRLWFVANHVLTMRTPLGRKMRGHVRGEGGPLLRVKRSHLDEAGVQPHRREA